MAYEYEFPRPAVTVDCVVFNWDGRQLSLLLIERSNDPFKGCRAFPGGFVDPNESLEGAARRELLEETGLAIGPLTLFGAFGDPGRDPRGHTVTIAYYTMIRDQEKPARAGSDAKSLSWMPLAHSVNLAFDHQKIQARACGRLRDDIRLSLCDKTELFELKTHEKEVLLTILSDYEKSFNIG